MTEADSPLALVLSGGGARGAYEIGVLRYILGKLIPRLGDSARPVIGVTGSATDVESGHTVVFMETEEAPGPLTSGDRAVDWTVVRLTPQHALASAAIPIIFPTVRVAGRMYSDGSLRQNTPIAPALRLGAGRVLVVGLRTPRTVPATRAGRQDADDQKALSSPLYLFGKLLDALLLDRVENDLANLRQVNAALHELARVSHAVPSSLAAALQNAGGGLRPVPDVFIRPSHDLGSMAAQILERPSVRARLSGPAGYLLRRLGEAAGRGDPSDMLSYLLFDVEYASELIRLGEQDASSRKEELEELLANPSAAPAREAVS